MSVFGVILVRIFPHFDWIRVRITPNMDTSYAVEAKYSYVTFLNCNEFPRLILLLSFHAKIKKSGADTAFKKGKTNWPRMLVSLAL